jgi:hypothetical protein
MVAVQSFFLFAYAEMMRSIAVVVGLTLLLQLNPGLESFKREAENALGNKIEVIESESTGSDNGQTLCDRTSAKILIRRGLPDDLKEQVLAHEIGHALLCARGLGGFSYSTDFARATRVEGVSAALGSLIQSCYIDPLADAEAARRHLKTEKTTEAVFEKTRSHTKKEIHESVSKGELYATVPAVSIYCVDLLPHSFPISEVESIFADEPSVISKLQKLRHDLGKPECSDARTCFTLTKKLRDDLELKQWIVLKNPETGTLE